MPATATIHLPPLTKRSMTDLRAKAKRLGISPADYAKRLIEDALEVQREAEQLSFAQIMRSVRKSTGPIEDSEIIRLVEAARGSHHAVSHRKKR